MKHITLALALLTGSAFAQVVTKTIEQLPALADPVAADLLMAYDVSATAPKSRKLTISNLGLVLQLPFANLTGKPTTLAGYGITDAFNPANPGPIGATPSTGSFTTLTATSSITANSGGLPVRLQGHPGFESTNSGLWFTASPTTSNYALLGSATTTFLNGPSTLSLGVANAGNLFLTENLVEQRNAGAPQTLRISRIANGVDFERLSITTDQGGTGPYTEIRTEAGGTGTERGLSFAAGNNGGQLSFATDGSFYFVKKNVAVRWSMDASGNFLAGADNAYDIGAAGASRVRNLYVAGAVHSPTFLGNYRVGANGQFGYVWGSSDGVIALYDIATTGFNRLQFGGTTAAFPAIKRNGAALDFRLADDSGYAEANLGTTLITKSGADANHTLVVKNSATQTGVSQQWQNSAGGIIAQIDTSGQAYYGGSITSLGSIFLSGSYFFGTDLAASFSRGIGGTIQSQSGNGVLALRKGYGNTVAVFADMPVASAANEGGMASISDGSTDVWGATVTGGGSLHVMIRSNGTNWTVVGK